MATSSAGATTFSSVSLLACRLPSPRAVSTLADRPGLAAFSISSSSRLSPGFSSPTSYSSSPPPGCVKCSGTISRSTMPVAGPVPGLEILITSGDIAADQHFLGGGDFQFQLGPRGHRLGRRSRREGDEGHGAQLAFLESGPPPSLRSAPRPAPGCRRSTPGCRPACAGLRAMVPTSRVLRGI